LCVLSGGGGLCCCFVLEAVLFGGPGTAALTGGCGCGCGLGVGVGVGALGTGTGVRRLADDVGGGSDQQRGAVPNLRVYVYLSRVPVEASAPSCAAVRRCAPLCAAVRRCASLCAAVHRCAQLSPAPAVLVRNSQPGCCRAHSPQ
jgi:hypothetical protein